MVIGILSLLAYGTAWNTNVCAFLSGPVFYLSYWTKSFLGRYLDTAAVPNEIFFISMTILYFGIIGFMLKELWNERGVIRYGSILAFSLFLLYLHYKSWQVLTAYFIPYT